MGAIGEWIKGFSQMPKEWRNPIRDVNSYRVALYTDVFFDGYHKETAKGHTAKLKQYGMDFYMPRGVTPSDIEEGFFAANQAIKNQMLTDRYGEDVVESMKNIQKIFARGFVLGYPIRTRRTIVFLDSASMEIIVESMKKTGEYRIRGAHIVATKYSKPQYEGHLPFDAGGREIYYKTDFVNAGWAPDKDFSGSKPYSIEMVSPELIKAEQDEQKAYNILVDPKEVIVEVG